MQYKTTLNRVRRLLSRTSLSLVFLLVCATITAQTTITTETGTNYTGANTFGAVNSAVTFVIENTNGYAITLTDVDSYFNPAIIGGGSGTVPTLWYSATSLSGAPTIGTPLWTQITTGPPVTLGAAGYYNVLTGMTFSIPSGAIYRFALQSSMGLSYSGSAAVFPTPNNFTAGGVTLRVGDAQIAAQNIGYAGAFPSPTFTPRYFTGRIKFTGICTPVNATAPVIAASPSSTCAGSPVTMNIIAGSLNGAAQWRWYTGSCGGTLVGTGTSITVSPAANTTYYVRGEGGCAPAPGPCTSKDITVTPCTCLTPGAATICEGSIQRLSVTLPPNTTATFSSAAAITIPSVGIATPYPSTIAVTGVTLGSRVKSVTLNNVNHTWPNDIDIVLVDPSGANRVIIMSDVGGGGTAITNRVYTFDDAAATTMPDVASPSGTYRPSNIGVPDNFPAPGPGSVNQPTPTFTTFGTGLMDGTWRLYVIDDVGGDAGSIAGGWSITFEAPFPTAQWSGGPMFTNAAATTPYVPGTEINAVYVMPTATTTYTATIASGPCAGANNVTVTVLPRPVLTVTPTSACGPVNLTASGADFYSWSPTSGLSASSGPTVTANPAVTTTYTVTGTLNNGCQSTATANVNSAPTASVIAPVAGATFQIQEGFTVAPPPGWVVTNNSNPNPAGSTSWFQGNAAVFPAFNGATTSYAAANWQNTTTTGPGDISTWLITPVVNIKNGDQISFYTRTTTGAFPDRLELRLSTAGNSSNVGTTSTSVGDFTTLLLTVNPNLLGGTAYPNVWTRFTATITGITGTVQGRAALRYWVTNGGGGANSDYIGVDQFEYSTPSTVNCANVVTNLAVNITGGVGPYTLVYSNGSTNTTMNGYVSGSNIQVSPAVTTTYTIVSVTGANGCVGTGNTGSATITITPAASVTTQPSSTNVCVGNNATFTVAAGPAVGNAYQWQVSVGGGPYTDLTNAAPYSGVTTTTLTITGATLAMNGNNYRVRVNGACGSPALSAPATLTVNSAAVITTQPVATSACSNGSTTFSVAATGGSLAYQWQVSTDGGTTWTNVSNGANYSGATTNTLTVNNPSTTFQGNLYRVLVTSAGCTATTSTSAALTTVNPAPVLVLTANPLTALTPGQSTTLSVAVSPNPGVAYQWFYNGVLIPNQSSNTLNVDIDSLGDYTVTVTDVNGCTSSSSTISITDASSDIVFIYPSPNRGQFQVRYNNASGNTGIRMLNIYDAKGARVVTRSYSINAPFQRMDVDLRHHGKGIYMVELVDRIGTRIKAGRVVIF